METSVHAKQANLRRVITTLSCDPDGVGDHSSWKIHRRNMELVSTVSGHVESLSWRTTRHVIRPRSRWSKRDTGSRDLA